MIQELIFDRVGFASNFFSSVVPCQRQWPLVPEETLSNLLVKTPIFQAPQV